MSYILTDGAGSIVAYPYSIGLLRRDNPQVSFPASPSNEQLAEWNVYPVQSVEQPAIDTLLEYITEGTPVLGDGGWSQVWVVNNYTPEEQTTVYNQFVDSATQQADALFEATNGYVTKALTEGLELDPDLIAYRSALSNPSSLTGYPNNITWPTPPTSFFVGSGETQVASIKATSVHVTGTLTVDGGLSSDKTWVSPDDTLWRIKEVSGGKEVTYQPAQTGYYGYYTALNTSSSVPSAHETVTVGTQNEVYYINVPLSALSYLQSVYLPGASITVGESTYTLEGSYGYGGEGPIGLNITSPASFTDGQMVTINAQAYQTDAFEILLNGNIVANDDPNYATHVGPGSFVVVNGTQYPIFGSSVITGPEGQQTLNLYIGTYIQLEPNESVELQLMIPEQANLWLDPAVDFGVSAEELRGYSLDYHAYSFDSGTLVGKIVVAIDDNPRVSHICSTSGASDTSAIDLETYSDTWYDDKGLLFKRTDGENDRIFIQWSGKAFYSPEWRD